MRMQNTRLKSNLSACAYAVLLPIPRLNYTDKYKYADLFQLNAQKNWFC